MKPAARSGKAKLHKGSGFSLEADGPYDRGKMDIEFVTEPFEEDKGGLAKLEGAFAEIRELMKRLNSMSPMPRKAEAGDFYTPDEHGLSNDVLLSKGAPRADFKMQVTHGIRLADIPKVFETFGIVPSNIPGEPGETRAEAKERSSARSIMNENDREQLQILGAAPGQARMVVDGLLNKKVIDRGDTSALVGFLTYALAYIQWVQVLQWSGLKTALPFMSRYDFAKLFGMLPPVQQQALRSPAGRKTLHAVVRAVLSMVGVQGRRSKPLMEGPMLQALSSLDDAPLDKQVFYGLIQTLTVDDWLDGMLDGKDYLTATGIYEYLGGKGKGREAAEYEKSLRIFTRGHGATKSLVGGEPNLAIMENRMIDPSSLGSKNLDVEQAHEISVGYFSFLAQLREGGAKFPTMKLV